MLREPRTVMRGRDAILLVLVAGVVFGFMFLFLFCFLCV